MAAKKHTHKYYRMPMSHQTVWACALPDCSHFIPKYMEQSVNSKKSICWDCGEEFILNPLALRMDRPICNECSGLANKIENDALHRLLPTLTDDDLENEDKPLYKDIKKE